MAFGLALRAASASFSASGLAFHAALSENGHVVNALKTVTEGVVKAIADEAARQRSAPAGYGPGAAHPSTPPKGFALAVNRTA